MAEPVHQVGGSVHRVQNPDRAREIDAAVVLLLPHKLDVRVQVQKPLLHLPLHGEVRFRGKVNVPLEGDPPGHFPVQKVGLHVPYDADHLLYVNVSLHIHSPRPYRPRYFSNSPQISLAACFSGISQKIRSSGSVPENRAMTHPLFRKYTLQPSM